MDSWPLALLAALIVFLIFAWMERTSRGPVPPLPRDPPAGDWPSIPPAEVPRAVR